MRLSGVTKLAVFLPAVLGVAGCTILTREPTRATLERETISLAKLYYEHKEYESAIARLEEMLPTVTDWGTKAAALYYLRACYIGLDRRADAEKVLERLKSECPRSAWLKVIELEEEVAWKAPLGAEKKPSWWRSFRASIHGLFVSEPDEVARYRLAKESLEKKRWEDAVSRFEEFLKLHPGSPLVPAARFRLAESYEGAGSSDKARAAYEIVATNHEGTGWAILAREKLGKSE